MRILVWQWGRRGAGPFYAAELARAFACVPGTTALLSLSTGAELMQGPNPPRCNLPVATYSGLAGLAARMLAAPLAAPRLARWLRRERVDLALCAMPAATDLVMAAALRLAGVPYVVVVHDAELHPGDRFAAQIRLQRWLTKGAVAVFALSQHVAARLHTLLPGKTVLLSALPPFHYGADLPAPFAHGGKLRLLSFGRLLPYKGLDLLADALARLGPLADLDVRVVGSGPASAELDRLAAMPGVTVENRWVPEAEMAALLGWADALILSHREASQSGVAVAALAARRLVVATNVGGLSEQLKDYPGAILCEPSPDALAEGVLALLNRPREPLAADTASTWQEIARKMVEDLPAARAGKSPSPA